MKEQTVRKRIFLSNAWILVISLLFLVLINFAVIKLYTELVEREWQQSAEQVIDEEQLKTLVKEWTVQKKSFIVLFLLDGVVCAGSLFLISHVFTRKLAGQICQPLQELEDGAKRVRQDDLTEEISYSGDQEFEAVCEAFNMMQAHIRKERERNAAYEKARTDMIAGISHDLKTPMTAVQGSLKALLDGIATEPEAQRRFLETAYRRAGDMNELLNQLFYLSKLETGNMPVQCQSIKPDAFVENYVKYQRECLNPETERLEYTIEDQEKLEEMVADPEQLRRVLDNLVANSRKYAEVEPLVMKIHLWQQADWTRIEFTDHGQGVSEEQLVHLFEEFYRCDEARSRKEGNGLGLYIVKCLVEAMGGTVRAENRDGLAICMELRNQPKEPVEKG